MDAKTLLDTLLRAAARIGQPAESAPGQAPGAGRSGPLAVPPKLDATVQQVTGQRTDELLRKARDVVEQNPGLAQAAALGVAGLLFGSRRARRGLPGNLARLGALAVIGGLAYKAFQGSRAGQTPVGGAAAPALGGSGGAPAPQAAGAPAGSLEVPEESRFHPVSQTEDDALLFLRTMVAAAACDGHIADDERGRIARGLAEAGIDPNATGWLERELESPADVEELAAGVTSPEKAAQVYAAARIAIEPDTIQEREFLRRLSEALDLDQAVQAQIDGTASALKSAGP